MKKDAPTRPAKKSAGTARKTSARKTATPPEADAPAAPAAKKNLLTAGIKALSDAHGEVVARQSRVFESILGLGAKRENDESRKPNPLAQAALDPFGFKKFEDVFDQRVARTLERLEVPSAESVAALRSELAALRDEVAQLRALLTKR